MITEDDTFKCDFCGQSNTGEYYLVTGNHVLCQDYEQKIATLRAQLAEAVSLIAEAKVEVGFSNALTDKPMKSSMAMYEKLVTYLQKVTPA